VSAGLSRDIWKSGVWHEHGAQEFCFVAFDGVYGIFIFKVAPL
jgi:hypothetical protein